MSVGTGDFHKRFHLPCAALGLGSVVFQAGCKRASCEIAVLHLGIRMLGLVRFLPSCFTHASGIWSYQTFASLSGASEFAIGGGVPKPTQWTNVETTCSVGSCCACASAGCKEITQTATDCLTTSAVQDSHCNNIVSKHVSAQRRQSVGVQLFFERGSSTDSTAVPNSLTERDWLVN